MITLYDLNISSGNDVSFVEKLYTESFPLSERRPYLTMIDMYRNSIGFHILLVKKEDQPIGFLTYWAFDDFVFAEHFAIAAEARNGGIGAKVMTLFMAKLVKPIVLEVELPTTILSERRIGFYQRLGYKLWSEFSYQQPPYYTDHNPIPMFLMTWGEINLTEKFATVKEQIYREVYGY